MAEPDILPAAALSGAEAICRGAIRLMHQRGFASVTELTLANGRRADIAALGPGGEFTLIEVKSCRADFMTDQKWPDYQPFCDRFYFAVDEAFPVELIPDEAGLIIADGFGGDVVREAPETPLVAARRKALTLRFARLAALRLQSGLVVDAGLWAT